ncbi:MAG TPA: hypothetical protein VIW73_13140 [Candidatus Cybelea sp.]
MADLPDALIILRLAAVAGWLAVLVIAIAKAIYGRRKLLAFVVVGVFGAIQPSFGDGRARISAVAPTSQHVSQKSFEKMTSMTISTANPNATVSADWSNHASFTASDHLNSASFLLLGFRSRAIRRRQRGAGLIALTASLAILLALAFK